MKRYFAFALTVLVLPSFASDQVLNCHIEIMKDDNRKYTVTGQGSVCIKYGTFTGEITLKEKSTLEIGPEATFSGKLIAGKANTVVNKGTWRAPLQVNCIFENRGSIYAHDLLVSSEGFLNHQGPAKIVVDQEFYNHGTLAINGLITVGSDFHNYSTVQMESSILSVKGKVINKGTILGANEFVKLSSLRADDLLVNEGKISGPLQFFDLCAKEIQNNGEIHPRVSNCATAPGTLSSQWLQIEGYNDASINKLNWYTAESNAKKVYVVQKSENGKEFSNVAVIENGKEVNPSIFHYTFQDIASDHHQDVYYRIMEVQKSGSVSYSDVIALRSIAYSRVR